MEANSQIANHTSNKLAAWLLSNKVSIFFLQNNVLARNSGIAFFEKSFESLPKYYSIVATQWCVFVLLPSAFATQLFFLSLILLCIRCWFFLLVAFLLREELCSQTFTTIYVAYTMLWMRAHCFGKKNCNRKSTYRTHLVDFWYRCRSNVTLKGKFMKTIFTFWYFSRLVLPTHTTHNTVCYSLAHSIVSIGYEYCKVCYGNGIACFSHPISLYIHIRTW